MGRVFPVIEKRTVRGVVLHVRIAAIAAGKVRLLHHQTVGIAGQKDLPAFHPTGQRREVGPGQRADDGLADRLLPPAFGLAVIHDHVRIAQLARDPKRQHPCFGAAVEGDTGIAERTEGHGHRDPAHRVIHDLMPCQVADRIGARGLARDFQRDHRLARVQPFLGRGGFECGIVDCGDAVFRRPARDDLDPAFHGCRLEIRPGPFVLPEIGIGRGHAGGGAKGSECRYQAHRDLHLSGVRVPVGRRSAKPPHADVRGPAICVTR